MKRRPGSSAITLTQRVMDPLFDTSSRKLADRILDFSTHIDIDPLRDDAPKHEAHALPVDSVDQVTITLIPMCGSKKWKKWPLQVRFIGSWSAMRVRLRGDVVDELVAQLAVRRGYEVCGFKFPRKVDLRNASRILVHRGRGRGCVLQPILAGPGRSCALLNAPLDARGSQRLLEWLAPLYGWKLSR